MSPGRSIFLFAALFLGSNLLLGLLLGAYAMSQGTDPQGFLMQLTEDPASVPGSVLRHILWIQTTVLFILPAVVFGLVVFGKRWPVALNLSRYPSASQGLLGILLLAAGYPLVNLAYELNGMIPMPEWAGSMEDTAAGLLGELLAMETPLQFVSTLLIIAVLPAIGEELVFRGILQGQFQKLMKNAHLAVWLAALVFSAVHFQFEGFLPRMALGAILGYLYLWTRNLWVPVLAHFFNNAVQVSALYFADVDLQAIETAEGTAMSPWVYVVSAICFAGIAFLLTNQRTPVDE